MSSDSHKTEFRSSTKQSRLENGGGSLPLTACRMSLDVRRSSRSRRTYALIGELGAFSPGLKSLRESQDFRAKSIRLCVDKYPKSIRILRDFRVLTQTLQPVHKPSKITLAFKVCVRTGKRSQNHPL